MQLISLKYIIKQQLTKVEIERYWIIIGDTDTTYSTVQKKSDKNSRKIMFEYQD